jgi:transcriptional regulator with XRE-family HTH domain
MATADERAGANLRRFREGADVSQTELARRMTAAGHAWQQSTVNRAESGTQPLRAGELETLAAMFRVSVDRFFWLAGEAAEEALAERAIGRLRQAAEDAATAVARLHAARAAADQAARDADRSKHARVRETAEAVRAEWRDATVKNVLAEAKARWDKERSGQ